MAAVFGVHVGNTTASLSCFKDEKVDVVANEAGYRVTPAVVAFHEHERITGLEAKANVVRNLSSTIIHNKFYVHLDPKNEDFEMICDKSRGKVFEEDGVIKYKIQEGEKEITITPDEVATCIYRSMQRIADTAERSKSAHKAVLAVPLNTPQSVLDRTKESAEAAGLEVLQIISEPCAATLAYQVGLQDPSQNCLCLVFRVGGVSSEATVVKIAGGALSIEGHVHYKDLGGDQLNKILADFIADEFHRKFKLDPRESKRSMAKLLNAAESWKHILSNLGSADCFVESLHEGIDYRVNISRARFEMLVSSNLQEFLQPIHSVLKKTGTSADKISHVIMCGGSLKIPRLQKIVSDMFGAANIMTGLAPDEVIAIGAARQASYLPESWESNFEDMTITVQATSKGIYFKEPHGDWKSLIPAASPIPFMKKMKLVVPNGCTEFVVEIAEDTDEEGAFNNLGSVTLHEMKGGTSILAEIKWTNSGLQVSVSDGREKRSAVEFAVSD